MYRFGLLVPDTHGLLGTPQGPKRCLTAPQGAVVIVPDWNPPTPVERVHGSPQLGLPSDLLSKPKAFGAAIFWAWCAGCPKPCNTCVSPRSLEGWFPPDAQDLHPASSGLPCCSFCCRYQLCFAVSSDVGIGLLGVWVGPSAVIR